jgi:hypothetical protein
MPRCSVMIISILFLSELLLPLASESTILPIADARGRPQLNY